MIAYQVLIRSTLWVCIRRLMIVMLSSAQVD
jgi:hypothetical protein